LQRHGADRIVVGIDAREGRVAVQGWTDTSAIEAADLAQRMGALGVSRVVYTDIGRDGMLSGSTQRFGEVGPRSGLRSSVLYARWTISRALRGYEDGVDRSHHRDGLYRGLVSLPRPDDRSRGLSMLADG